MNKENKRKLERLRKLIDVHTEEVAELFMSLSQSALAETSDLSKRALEADAANVRDIRDRLRHVRFGIDMVLTDE